MNKIREAFETVKADDRLKNSALEAVRNKIYEENLKDEKAKSRGAGNKRQGVGIFSGTGYGRKILYGAAAFCALIFAVGIFGFYSAYTSPSSYVSIDINPSMELTLNRFNIVIDAKGYNDDGEKALESIELSGMNYTDAIEKLLESSQLQSYFSSDYELVFTVISENQQEIIEGIESTSGYQKYGSCCLTADYETREEAQNAGMSVGKYRAYQQLLLYYPDMTAQECSELSMNEIKNLIIENGGEWQGSSQNGAQSGLQNGNQEGCQNGGQSGSQNGSQGGSRNEGQSGSQSQGQGGSQNMAQSGKDEDTSSGQSGDDEKYGHQWGTGSGKSQGKGSG